MDGAFRPALVAASLFAAGCCPDSGVITLGATAGLASNGGSAASGTGGAGSTSATGGAPTSSITGGSAGTTAGTAGSGSTGSAAGSGTTGAATSSGGASSGSAGSSGGSSSGTAPFSSLSLFAGQLGGQGYVDGDGSAARFWGADDVVGDGQGHLYVADTGASTIREIDLATGAVTTLAGTAAENGVVDGTGASARFGDPYGIAYDGAGNLFVADTYNDTIRQVVIATGAVTTIAGEPGVSGSADGTGSEASFWYPQGIATDGAGNLFVADTNNCTIREVAASSGVVSTLAGTAGACGDADGTGAAASFSLPSGIAYDGAGNLYVADTGNQTIRKVVVSSGVVTTFAGTVGATGDADGTGTAASFDQPIGLAYDGAGRLLVADSGNDLIRTIALASAQVTTLAGNPGIQGFVDGTGSSANFHFPWGVGSDGAGNAFVADSYNDTLRQVVEDSQVTTTVAGLAPHEGNVDGTGAAAEFYNPQSIAYDGTANLFVADSYDDTIREVAVATAAVSTLAGDAGVEGSADGTGALATFNGPRGVASDEAGNLYIADTGNSTIRKVVVASGAVTTLAGAAGTVGHADGTGAAASFYLPWAIAWGGGTLYVADSFNNTVRAVDPTSGAVSTLAGTPGTGGEANGTGPDAGFSGPDGLAYDGAGTLYVSDSEGETVRAVTVATSAVTTLAGTPNVPGSSDGVGAAALFSGPGPLVWDGAGHLFVSDVGNSTIREIDVASGAVTTVIGVPGHAGVILGALPGGLNWPVGLAFVSPALYIADSNENALLVAR